MERSLRVGIYVFCIFASFSSAPVHAASLEDAGIQPLVTTSELVIGTNRFAFGLMKAGKLLEAVDVKLRLYAFDNMEARLAADVNVPYAALKNVKRERSVHSHADGTVHVHGGDSDVRGLYVTHLVFSRAGNWGIELVAKQGNEPTETIRFAVKVLSAPISPAVGSSAPRSHNLIASDVKTLGEIDTSAKPDPRLHQIRIADAIAHRRPQLIVFATPQFCTSRMCGPVVDIVRTLLPVYEKRVAFIHQEIWQDFAAKKMFPTVEEWQLDTEPWIFVVDSEGIIRSKFEGLVTAQEIESALQHVL